MLRLPLIVAALTAATGCYDASLRPLEEQGSGTPAGSFAGSDEPSDPVWSGSSGDLEVLSARAVCDTWEDFFLYELVVDGGSAVDSVTVTLTDNFWDEFVDQHVVPASGPDAWTLEVDADDTAAFCLADIDVTWMMRLRGGGSEEVVRPLQNL